LRILDTGCGIGILTLALRLLNYNIVGIDKYVFVPSRRFFVEDIDKLKKIWKEHDLSILSHDIFSEKLSNKYDVIISVAVIEHQAYPKFFIKNLMRNLDENGLLYIATPNVVNLTNRLRVLIGRPPLGNIKEFYHDADVFTGHFREYTLSELEVMFCISGLNIIFSKNLYSGKLKFK